MSPDQQSTEVFKNPSDFNENAGTWRGISVPKLPNPVNKVEFIDTEVLPRPNSTGLPSFRAALTSTVEVFTSGLIINDDETRIKLTVNTPPPKLETAAQLAIPAHKLAKKSPEDVQALAEHINTSGNSMTAEVDGSFINVAVNPEVLNRKTLQDIFSLKEMYGANNEGARKLVAIDLSSPNIAKQMHLGHLRSTVIGESIRRILQFNGYDVIRDNHVGDWGTQFGYLGRAVELWGHEVQDLLNSDDHALQIEGLLKLYIKINQQIAIEKESSADGNSELEDAGREWFVRLERGDKDAVDFWHWASTLSMLEFQEVYDKLGIDFEYVLGESVYETTNQSVIQAFKDANLTFVDEKYGVLKVHPSRKKGDSLAIQKPDGTSLYGTRDLATIAARMHWFNPDKIVYVVGGDQDAYFVNVFDAMSQYLQATDPESKPLDMVHVSFGAVELPEGKMSTRKGTVVPLRDVITIMEDEVRVRVQKNMEARKVNLHEREMEKIVGQVAIGSLIYYDLRGATSRKIIYDPKEVTSFEGNSGASLQYTVSRINSLLEHAGYDPYAGANSPDSWHFSSEVNPENSLIRRLSTFSDFVKQAAEKYEPSIISDYLVHVASDYNSLIEHTRIIDNQDETARKRLLDISAATRQVMINGLRLLNIPSPERM